MSAPLLDVSHVSIEIDDRELLTNLSLTLHHGEALGIVGETGSGKSLACRSFAGSLDSIGGRVSHGSISLAGVDMTAGADRRKLNVYGRTVSVVPQNSLAALNPLMKIGKHLVETIRVLKAAEGGRVRSLALELLERVGIPNPERVMRQYPHQLSGGMRQRVMIALAIAGKPQLLIADEPTTALDVSVQKDILELLRRLSAESNMALILVSHDLGVVRTATQSIAVLYAGTVVEHGPTDTVLENPRHPYTQALLAARPSIGRKGRLSGIPGSTASPDAWPTGCRFAPRCPHVIPECNAGIPPLAPVGEQHHAACIRDIELRTLNGTVVTT